VEGRLRNRKDGAFDRGGEAVPSAALRSISSLSSTEIPGAGSRLSSSFREVAVRPPSLRRLSDDERRVVIETLTSPELADEPPAEVFATLLGRGVYLASIRTMYRLLAMHFGVIPDRRAQRLVRHHAPPSLEATLPNQVRTWDITKLAGPERGVFYCLYVVVDLFSRYVVGWMVPNPKTCEP
jgi:transposase InsO family protein